MNFTLKAANIWEFGARKDAAGNPHQEDSLFPPFGRVPDSSRLFIVCDGMGGHEAGEVASATVVEALSKAIPADGAQVFTELDFRRALDAAYDALDGIECHETRKPGTTLTLLKLHAGGATIAHIGDSRLYHIRPGETAEQTRILHKTSDHSLVNELVKMGEMTEEQARTSSQRNVITRAMQPKLSPRPAADLHTTTDIRPGDWFYLCSDGMLEQMTDADLRALFSREGGDMQQKIKELTEATAHNQDNHTAILVEITDVQGAAAAERPVTSMLTPEMSKEADAVAERIAGSEREADARQSKPRSRTIPILLLIMVLLIAVAAWFFFTPTKSAEPRAEADTQAPPPTEAPMAEAEPRAEAPQKEPAAPPTRERHAHQSPPAAPAPKPAEEPAAAPVSTPAIKHISGQPATRPAQEPADADDHMQNSTSKENPYN